VLRLFVSLPCAKPACPSRAARRRVERPACLKQLHSPRLPLYPRCRAALFLAAPAHDGRCCSAPAAPRSLTLDRNGQLSAPSFSVLSGLTALEDLNLSENSLAAFPRQVGPDVLCRAHPPGLPTAARCADALAEAPRSCTGL
jgi:hypothetical protein